MPDTPTPKPAPSVKTTTSGKGDDKQVTATTVDPAASMPLASNSETGEGETPDLTAMKSEAEERAERRQARLAEQQEADVKAGVVGSPVLAGQADEYAVTTPPTGPAPLPNSFPDAPVYPTDEPLTPDLTVHGTNVDAMRAAAGLEANAVPLAQIGPSEPVRNPDSKAPCVPGAWPVPEDQLPAVTQLDHVATGDGDDLPFEGSAESGYSLKSRAGSILKLDKRDSAAAAEMYRSVRAQYPQFTLAQVSDEFRLRWESQIGARQSMRPVDAVSPHGATAVGDFRLDAPEPIAALREDAGEAEPEPRLAERATYGEPALLAVDDSKTKQGPANPDSQV